MLRRVRIKRGSYTYTAKGAMEAANLTREGLYQPDYLDIPEYAFGPLRSMRREISQSINFRDYNSNLAAFNDTELHILESRRAVLINKLKQQFIKYKSGEQTVRDELSTITDLQELHTFINGNFKDCIEAQTDLILIWREIEKLNREIEPLQSQQGNVAQHTLLQANIADDNELPAEYIVVDTAQPDHLAAQFQLEPETYHSHAVFSQFDAIAVSHASQAFLTPDENGTYTNGPIWEFIEDQRAVVDGHRTPWGFAFFPPLAWLIYGRDYGDNFRLAHGRQVEKWAFDAEMNAQGLAEQAYTLLNKHLVDEQVSPADAEYYLQMVEKFGNYRVANILNDKKPAFLTFIDQEKKKVKDTIPKWWHIRSNAQEKRKKDERYLHYLEHLANHVRSTNEILLSINTNIPTDVNLLTLFQEALERVSGFQITFADQAALKARLESVHADEKQQNRRAIAIVIDNLKAKQPWIRLREVTKEKYRKLTVAIEQLESLAEIINAQNVAAATDDTHFKFVMTTLVAGEERTSSERFFEAFNNQSDINDEAKIKFEQQRPFKDAFERVLQTTDLGKDFYEKFVEYLRSNGRATEVPAAPAGTPRQDYAISKREISAAAAIFENVEDQNRITSNLAFVQQYLDELNTNPKFNEIQKASYKQLLKLCEQYLLPPERSLKERLQLRINSITGEYGDLWTRICEQGVNTEIIEQTKPLLTMAILAAEKDVGDSTELFANTDQTILTSAGKLKALKLLESLINGNLLVLLDEKLSSEDEKLLELICPTQRIKDNDPSHNWGSNLAFIVSQYGKFYLREEFKKNPANDEERRANEQRINFYLNLFKHHGNVEMHAQYEDLTEDAITYFREFFYEIVPNDREYNLSADPAQSCSLGMGKPSLSYTLEEMQKQTRFVKVFPEATAQVEEYVDRYLHGSLEARLRRLVKEGWITEAQKAEIQTLGSDALDNYIRNTLRLNNQTQLEILRDARKLTQTIRTVNETGIETEIPGEFETLMGLIDNSENYLKQINWLVRQGKLTVEEKNKTCLADGHARALLNILQEPTNRNKFDGRKEDVTYAKAILIIGTEDQVKDYLITRLTVLLERGDEIRITQDDRNFFSQVKTDHSVAWASLNQIFKLYIELDDRKWNKFTSDFIESCASDEIRQIYRVLRIKELLASGVDLPASYQPSEAVITYVQSLEANLINAQDVFAAKFNTTLERHLDRDFVGRDEKWCFTTEYLATKFASPELLQRVRINKVNYLIKSDDKAESLNYITYLNEQGYQSTDRFNLYAAETTLHSNGEAEIARNIALILPQGWTENLEMLGVAFASKQILFAIRKANIQALLIAGASDAEWIAAQSEADRYIAMVKNPIKPLLPRAVDEDPESIPLLDAIFETFADNPGIRWNETADRLLEEWGTQERKDSYRLKRLAELLDENDPDETERYLLELERLRAIGDPKRNPAFASIVLSDAGKGHLSELLQYWFSARAWNVNTDMLINAFGSKALLQAYNRKRIAEIMEPAGTSFLGQHNTAPEIEIQTVLQQLHAKLAVDLFLVAGMSTAVTVFVRTQETSVDAINRLIISQLEQVSSLEPAVRAFYSNAIIHLCNNEELKQDVVNRIRSAVFASDQRSVDLRTFIEDFIGLLQFIATAKQDHLYLRDEAERFMPKNPAGTRPTREQIKALFGDTPAERTEAMRLFAGHVNGVNARIQAANVASRTACLADFQTESQTMLCEQYFTRTSCADTGFDFDDALTQWENLLKDDYQDKDPMRILRKIIADIQRHDYEQIKTDFGVLLSEQQTAERDARSADKMRKAAKRVRTVEVGVIELVKEYVGYLGDATVTRIRNSATALAATETYDDTFVRTVLALTAAQLPPYASVDLQYAIRRMGGNEGNIEIVKSCLQQKARDLYIATPRNVTEIRAVERILSELNDKHFSSEVANIVRFVGSLEQELRETFIENLIQYRIAIDTDNVEFMIAATINIAHDYLVVELDFAVREVARTLQMLDINAISGLRLFIQNIALKNQKAVIPAIQTIFDSIFSVIVNPVIKAKFNEWAKIVLDALQTNAEMKNTFVGNLKRFANDSNNTDNRKLLMQIVNLVKNGLVTKYQRDFATTAEAIRAFSTVKGCQQYLNNEIVSKTMLFTLQAKAWELAAIDEQVKVTQHLDELLRSGGLVAQFANQDIKDEIVWINTNKNRINAAYASIYRSIDDSIAAELPAFIVNIEELRLLANGLDKHRLGLLRQQFDKFKHYIYNSYSSMSDAFNEFIAPVEEAIFGKCELSPEVLSSLTKTIQILVTLDKMFFNEVISNEECELLFDVLTFSGLTGADKLFLQSYIFQLRAKSELGIHEVADVMIARINGSTLDEQQKFALEEYKAFVKIKNAVKDDSIVRMDSNIRLIANSKNVSLRYACQLFLETVSNITIQAYFYNTNEEVLKITDMVSGGFLALKELRDLLRPNMLIPKTLIDSIIFSNKENLIQQCQTLISNLALPEYAELFENNIYLINSPLISDDKRVEVLRFLIDKIYTKYLETARELSKNEMAILLLCQRYNLIPGIHQFLNNCLQTFTPAYINSPTMVELIKLFGNEEHKEALRYVRSMFELESFIIDRREMAAVADSAAMARRSSTVSDRSFSGAGSANDSFSSIGGFSDISVPTYSESAWRNYERLTEAFSANVPGASLKTAIIDKVRLQWEGCRDRVDLHFSDPELIARMQEKLKGFINPLLPEHFPENALFSLSLYLSLMLGNDGKALNESLFKIVETKKSVSSPAKFAGSAISRNIEKIEQTIVIKQEHQETLKAALQQLYYLLMHELHNKGNINTFAHMFSFAKENPSVNYLADLIVGEQKFTNLVKLNDDIQQAKENLSDFVTKTFVAIPGGRAAITLDINSDDFLINAVNLLINTADQAKEFKRYADLNRSEAKKQEHKERIQKGLAALRLLIQHTPEIHAIVADRLQTFVNHYISETANGRSTSYGTQWARRIVEEFGSSESIKRFDDAILNAHRLSKIRYSFSNPPMSMAAILVAINQDYGRLNFPKLQQTYTEAVSFISYQLDGINDMFQDDQKILMVIWEQLNAGLEPPLVCEVLTARNVKRAVFERLEQEFAVKLNVAKAIEAIKNANVVTASIATAKTTQLLLNQEFDMSIYERFKELAFGVISDLPEDTAVLQEFAHCFRRQFGFELTTPAALTRESLKEAITVSVEQHAMLHLVHAHQALFSAEELSHRQFFDLNKWSSSYASLTTQLDDVLETFPETDRLIPLFVAEFNRVNNLTGDNQVVLAVNNKQCLQERLLEFLQQRLIDNLVRDFSNDDILSVRAQLGTMQQYLDWSYAGSFIEKTLFLKNMRSILADMTVKNWQSVYSVLKTNVTTALNGLINQPTVINYFVTQFNNKFAATNVLLQPATRNDVTTLQQSMAQFLESLFIEKMTGIFNAAIVRQRLDAAESAEFTVVADGAGSADDPRATPAGTIGDAPEVVNSNLAKIAQLQTVSAQLKGEFAMLMEQLSDEAVSAFVEGFNRTASVSSFRMSVARRVNKEILSIAFNTFVENIVDQYQKELSRAAAYSYTAGSVSTDTAVSIAAR